MADLPVVVIVGGATLLGQEVKDLLESRSLPISTVRLLSAGEEGEAPGLHARLADFGGEAVVETPISATEIEGAAIVFVCDPAAQGHAALATAPRVIDLTRGGRPSDPAYRLAVSGIDDGDLRSARLLASPHPVAVMVAHVLHALAPLDPRDIVVTAMLGASHSGRAGVEELLEQTRAALTFSEVPKEVFGRQLAFNLLPPFAPGSAEAPIADELRAVTGRTVAVSVVTVPIFYGVAATIHVTLDGADRAAVLGLLQGCPAIGVHLDEDASPVGTVGDDSVVVGTLEPDPRQPGAFWIWCVCDNARRGGALNAVELAERILLS